MSRDPVSLLEDGAYKEARLKGRRLARVMHEEVVKALDDTIEEWFSEHTSMVRDDPWVQEYVHTVRREALTGLADKLYAQT